MKLNSPKITTSYSTKITNKNLGMDTNIKSYFDNIVKLRRYLSIPNTFSVVIIFSKWLKQ